jgi:hypothetical protein
MTVNEVVQIVSEVTVRGFIQTIHEVKGKVVPVEAYGGVHT